MHRASLARLVDEVSSGRRRAAYLEGSPGSGKSAALYALVCWARSAGWTVLYVPSATLLTKGSMYARGEDGMWDTADAAVQLLDAFEGAHQPQAETIRTADGSRTLAELIDAGKATTDPRTAVDAALMLKDALLASTTASTMVAVDDYNALYDVSWYHEAVHSFHRRRIHCNELRLAKGFRVLEAPPSGNNSKCMVVAAPTAGASFSPRLAVPAPVGSRLQVPRYGLTEVAGAAQCYSAAGLVAGGSPEGDVPDIAVLRRAHFLTAGNGKELREGARTLLLADEPLGLSMGRRALIAVKKAHLHDVVNAA
jgi:hypothetical protein